MLKDLQAKPSPGEDDVHTRPIPNSDYSFRLWGKGLELKREYCLDFVHNATGKPVNSPFKYELWVVPSTSAPWLPGAVKSRIYSLERCFGIPQQDILPGAEKFVLLEGTACLLVRPGMRSVYFKVPIRSPPDLNCNLGDVDQIKFS
ncbi:hypothetical protein SCLCIDRAFT_392373 [Scleroderma citrinum Foug A]|uniref:Uncharacterized protein n=1 Tax=Scleroderma citrinum Foug A TaxID=1036808 RepID=A0A0C3DCQ9_9AGAM|nr:hypothetical protein SCLCIDRAFT_392373 [Scleroderma citrinum Foug A]